MIRTTLLVLVMVLATTAQAGEGRARLDAFLSGLQTLQAKFDQSVLDTENSRSGVYHGVFFLQRPDRFRWNYIAPYVQTVVADGRDVWIVEEDLNQTSRQLQALALKGTPAELLLGSRPIDEAFDVGEIGQREGLYWLELLPRGHDGDVERILLAFAGNDLARIEFRDKFGQISRFRFFELERNKPLDPQLFVFDVPPSMDIFNY